MPHDQAGGREIHLKRVYENDATVQVETRPTFVNNVVLHRLGGSIYMDIGVVPIDDILAIKDRSGDARFIVLDRLVMGPEGFLVLYTNVNRLFAALQKEGFFSDEAEKAAADAGGTENAGAA